VPAPIVASSTRRWGRRSIGPLCRRARDVATVVAPPDRRSPDYLCGFLASEIKTWGAAIKASGIEPQ
jgi:hypothetical protein